MRIAIAELKQETNSFVPFQTTLATFQDQYLFRGAEMAACSASSSKC